MCVTHCTCAGLPHNACIHWFYSPAYPIAWCPEASSKEATNYKGLTNRICKGMEYWGVSPCAPEMLVYSFWATTYMYTFLFNLPVIIINTGKYF